MKSLFPDEKRPRVLPTAGRVVQHRTRSEKRGNPPSFCTLLSGVLQDQSYLQLEGYHYFQSLVHATRASDVRRHTRLETILLALHNSPMAVAHVGEPERAKASKTLRRKPE